MAWWTLLPLACASPVELGPAHAPPGDSGEATFVPLPCAGTPCIAPRQAGVAVGYHRLRVTGARIAWLSWVEVESLRPLAMYVAASPGPGAPFGAPIEVPTLEPPVVGGTEKPGFDLLGDRIAISHTGVGDLRHGDAVAVYVMGGTVDGSQATFDPAALIDLASTEGWVAEQALVALTPGDTWLAYKRQVYGLRDVPTFARASADWSPDSVSEALSHSHECSPPDLVRGVDGQVRMALRSNVAGTLQTMVVVQDGNGFGAPVQLSHSDWAYNPDVCTVDGPRIAQRPDGALVTTWIAPADERFRSWIAGSTDGGATWSEPVLDHAAVGFGEQYPTVTAVGEELWTTVEVPGDGTWLFRRVEITSEPTAERIDGPGGIPLDNVEIASGGGRTVAAGIGEDGRIWLVEIPDLR